MGEGALPPRHPQRTPPSHPLRHPLRAAPCPHPPPPRTSSAAACTQSRASTSSRPVASASSSTARRSGSASRRTGPAGVSGRRLDTAARESGLLACVGDGGRGAGAGRAAGRQAGRQASQAVRSIGPPIDRAAERRAHLVAQEVEEVGAGQLQDGQQLGGGGGAVIAPVQRPLHLLQQVPKVAGHRRPLPLKPS